MVDQTKPREALHDAGRRAALPFRLRVRVLHRALAERVAEAAGEEHLEPLELEVPRQDVLRNVCHTLGVDASGTVNAAARGITVRFENEMGEDLGGLRREWLLAAASELTDPGRGMFQSDLDGKLCFSPVGCSDEVGQMESRVFSALLGRLIGLALYHRVPILDHSCRL